MALNPTNLATELKDSLGFTSSPNSAQILGLAQDIVDHLGAAIVSNAIISMTGDAPPPGGQIINGTSNNGTILLVISDLQNKFVSTFGVSTPEILGFASALTNFFMTTGTVAFASGDIKGICTNTTSNPGPVTLGEGVNGTISLGAAATLATNITSALGQPSSSPELSQFCQALIDHITINGVATYPTGSVVGNCAANGGPIPDLMATGGTIA